MDLLLLSNSRNHGAEPLSHAHEEISAFLRGIDRLVFVPYAGHDHDAYTATIAQALAPVDVEVIGVHTASDPRAMVEQAPAVFVGGGNSFRLLSALYGEGLHEPLAERARAGTLRYMGASAGTNMACPTLRTTNDMPIVEPPAFRALGLLPFQINPHYVDPQPGSTHMGETREQRLNEFLEENDVPVLGLREGAWLRVRDGEARIGGRRGARLFTRAEPPRELADDADVSFLLATEPAFDTR